MTTLPPKKTYQTVNLPVDAINAVLGTELEPGLVLLNYLKHPDGPTRSIRNAEVGGGVLAYTTPALFINSSIPSQYENRFSSQNR